MAALIEILIIVAAVGFASMRIQSVRHFRDAPPAYEGRHQRAAGVARAFELIE